MATINDFYRPHGEDGIVQNTNFSGFSKTGRITKGRGAAKANANSLRASIYNDIEIQDIARSYGDRVAAGVEFFNQQRVQQQVAEDYGNRVAEGVKFFKDRDRINAETADYDSTMDASDNISVEPKRATIDTPAAPAKPIVRFKDPYGVQNIGFEDGQGWNISRSRQGSPEMKAEDLAKTFDDNIGYDYQEFKNDNPVRNKRNEFFDRKNSVKIDQTGKVEHFKNKALGGGWGSKMKKAGAIGLGAVVAGGVIANLMGNGGQQTNAQLYGQQPIY